MFRIVYKNNVGILVDNKVECILINNEGFLLEYNFNIKVIYDLIKSFFFC